MKTYFSICTLFVFVILSCSKSDSGPTDDITPISLDAGYVTLLSKDGLLKPQLLNANGETIGLNPAETSLSEKTTPDLRFVDGTQFLQYHKDGDCGGQITKHDFKDDTTSDIPVFTDLNDCELMTTAIAQSGDLLFISYVVTSSNPDDYFVRIVDLSAAESSPEDVILDKKPVGLTVANNRLFILTFDELITDENSLSVMDMSNNTLIHEMGLGNRARRIFTDVQDNVIISYDELHTTLDSATLAFEFTQYESSTAPWFSAAETSHFDVDGRLFYPMDPTSNSIYPLVPAIYDFSEKLVTLYAYENFLTETKRDFEFEIETTSAVGFDDKNGLMVVGYKKLASATKEGGILRIRLEPEPAFIDNIDLDGVPVEIIMN